MTSRRVFNRAVAGASVGSLLGDWSSLLEISPLTARETQLSPDVVTFRPEIEPVVKLIENTPREKCFEMMVAQLRRGLPYRQFLAALMLAGIRNVNPQPPGFKFHCVFVVQSAHQLSLDVPVQDRLLPLFWVLDEFKKSQARDVEEGDFKLPAPPSRLPSPEMAWREFHDAMEAWDEERADRAITAVIRSSGSQQVIEALWEYGARDYRNIGHKPIFVANAIRTLQTIGWQHAEPILRSLVLGLLDFGETEKVNGFAFDDQCFLPNLEHASAQGLPADWAEGGEDADRTRELLSILRNEKATTACRRVFEQLKSGELQAQPAWDAVHLAACELMMRRPGIYGIHTVTSVNALRYAFEQSGVNSHRLLMLLQGAGWMCQFRDFMASGGDGLNDQDILQFDAIDSPNDDSAALESIFSGQVADPSTAAAEALYFARRGGSLPAFLSAARRQMLKRTTDAHGFKYPVALFEDHQRVSPIWRPSLLATSLYYLPTSARPESNVLQQARAILSG